MIPIIFSEDEIELLRKSERQNSKQMFTWSFPNVIFPLVIIVFSWACYWFVREDSSLAKFVFVVLNGSLPMIAINRLGTIGLNVIKWNKQNELKKDVDSELLRTKIICYSICVLLFVAGIYVYQVLKKDSSLGICMIIGQIVFSCIFIYISFEFSRYAYFIQERMMERTTGDDILDEVKENKNRLNEKYGD